MATAPDVLQRDTEREGVDPRIEKVIRDAAREERVVAEIRQLGDAVRQLGETLNLFIGEARAADRFASTRQHDQALRIDQLKQQLRRQGMLDEDEE